jgi:hypothetical protein
MNTSAPALAEHADRLTASTGLTFEQAREVARTGGESQASQALHAGYSAADRTGR